MSHVLTRTRAVVGGGILAVLLLACFSALPGAQESTDPRPGSRLPVTLPITQRVTVVLGVPLMIAGFVVLWRMSRVHRGDRGVQ